MQITRCYSLHSLEVSGSNGKVKNRQKEVSAIECKKAFITLGSPVVPLLSTSKADSGLASEFRRDRAIYTAYERMLKEWGRSKGNEAEDGMQLRATRCNSGKQRNERRSIEGRRREEICSLVSSTRAAWGAKASSRELLC